MPPSQDGSASPLPQRPFVTPTDEDIKTLFDENGGSRRGVVDIAAVRRVLEEHGRTPEQIDEALATLPPERLRKPLGLTEFRWLFHAPQKPYRVHDVPIVGWLTCAVSDGFSGVARTNPTAQDVEDAFSIRDIRGTGLLDKTEMAEALRLLGKSERQIQRALNTVKEPEVDAAGFRARVLPDWRPWLFKVGPVPLPNHEKVLDVPVLGQTLTTADSLVAQPADFALMKSWQAFTPCDDRIIEESFRKLDVRGKGRLGKSEVATLLRQWAWTEVQIRPALDKVMADGMTLEEFKFVLRGNKYVPYYSSHVPIVGPAVTQNFIRTFDQDYSDEDLREAFRYADHDGDGKICKAEVGKAMRYLGQSELEVQRAVDALEQEQIDFDSFKQIFNPQSRTYLTTINGYTAPNPAKVHDIPVLGSVTGLVSDLATESYDWTAGAALRRKQRPTEDQVKERLVQIDKEGDRDGKLTKVEIGGAMRGFGWTEGQIGYCLDDVGSTDLFTVAQVQEIVRSGAPPARP